MVKNIGIIVSIITIIGFLYKGINAFGKVEEKQKFNEEKIIELKEETKELEKDVDTNENINLQQSVILERVVKTLDKLEEKL